MTHSVLQVSHHTTSHTLQYLNVCLCSQCSCIPSPFYNGPGIHWHFRNHALVGASGIVLRLYGRIERTLFNQGSSLVSDTPPGGVVLPRLARVRTQTYYTTICKGVKFLREREPSQQNNTTPPHDTRTTSSKRRFSRSVSIRSRPSSIAIVTQ